MQFGLKTDTFFDTNPVSLPPCFHRLVYTSNLPLEGLRSFVATLNLATRPKQQCRGS